MTIPRGKDKRREAKSPTATFLMYVFVGTVFSDRCCDIAKHTAKFPMTPAKAINASTESRITTNQSGSRALAVKVFVWVKLPLGTSVELLKDMACSVYKIGKWQWRVLGNIQRFLRVPFL